MAPSLLGDNGPDPSGLYEYSVVYTDRALNHMSSSFKKVMTDINTNLCNVYNADNCIIVPGSGTFAMEAVARQFGHNKRVMIIRNGYFSYRWTQIFEIGNFTKEEPKVIKAIPIEINKDNQEEQQSYKYQFQPPNVNDVIDLINEYKPDVVFAPHVETSAGMIIPDDYLKKLVKLYMIIMVYLY